MSIRADAESLRLIPIFRRCESVPLQVLAFASERQHFNRDDVIITEGKRVDAAYFILDGSASIIRAKSVIGQAEPGSLLGETAMLGNTPSTITAKAEMPLRCAKIDLALFQRVAAEYPEFGQSVLAVLSERLQLTVEELASVRGLLIQARSFSSLTV